MMIYLEEFFKYIYSSKLKSIHTLSKKKGGGAFGIQIHVQTLNIYVLRVNLFPEKRWALAKR